MRFTSPPDKRDVDKLTQEFLAESFEGLDRMDRCLTELETRPGDMELVGEVFRALHTIKGTTGFLGFKRVETLAHAGENVIGAVRSGRLKASTEVVSGLLKGMDALRGLVRLIERTGYEGECSDDADSSLLGMLNDLCGCANSNEPSPPATGVAAVSAFAARASEKTIRIEVEILNRMMNLVGELVLTRNQMLRSQVDKESFPQLARRLDAVTIDLRDVVMQARMQPVGQLFGKFPRLVRDLALSCGKEVRLVLEGQDTALDKSLLEAIKDPLTHALRNAIDHGVESPTERLAAGKPRLGLVRVTAFHREGAVVIELADDGGGINVEKVLAKAAQANLVTADAASKMTPAEKLQLIFLPGVSTARTVTNLSGRGVGMDVVKNNIERIGGSVEITSALGKGTMLRLRIPLTLAIIPALVVESGGQSFCLPQSALLELVHVPWKEASELVEKIGEAEMYRLRETLLPMVWLDRLLELEADERRRADHGFYLAVLEFEGCRFGLAVDELVAPEEIVVKPLTNGLREIGMFSGATVLGHGGVAMILDVSTLALRGGMRPMAQHAGRKQPEAKTRPRFLVFGGRLQGRQPERIALALESVERIEKVALVRVEYASGRAMLQYGSALVLLEDVSGVLAESRGLSGSTVLTVLICKRPRARGGHHRVGLVVRGVLDVASGAVVPGGTRMLEGFDDGEKLALVNERLAVVHEAFAGQSMQEVA